MREPVAVDVLVAVDDLIEVVDESVEGTRLLNRVQPEVRITLERHLRHDAERAQADTRAREHLRLLIGGTAQHVAAGGHELERGDERRQPAEALSASLGGGRHPARGPLAGAIAAIWKGAG